MWDWPPLDSPDLTDPARVLLACALSRLCCCCGRSARARAPTSMTTRACALCRVAQAPGQKLVVASSDGCADHWGIVAAGGRSPDIVDAPRRELGQGPPQMEGAAFTWWAEPPSRVLCRRRRGGGGVQQSSAGCAGHWGIAAEGGRSPSAQINLRTAATCIILAGSLRRAQLFYLDYLDSASGLSRLPHGLS